MNYSVEYIERKISGYLAQIDKYQREIRWLRKEITALEYEPVTNDEGEITSYGDIKRQI